MTPTCDPKPGEQGPLAHQGDILGDTDFDFESFHFLIPYSQISRLHEFNIDRFLDYQIPDSMLSARGNQSTALRHFCDSSGPQIGQALFLHVCCRKPNKYLCFWTLVAEHLVNIAVFACVSFWRCFAQPMPNSMNFTEPPTPNAMHFNKPPTPHSMNFKEPLIPTSMNFYVNIGAHFIQKVCPVPAIASLAQLVRAWGC